MYIPGPDKQISQEQDYSDSWHYIHIPYLFTYIYPIFFCVFTIGNQSMLPNLLATAVQSMR